MRLRHMRRITRNPVCGTSTHPDGPIHARIGPFRCLPNAAWSLTWSHMPVQWCLLGRTKRKAIGGRLYGVDMTERVGILAVRDEDLVERAAGGDVDAFEVLVAARLSRAFRTASAILGSEADAHDVVQDAFVATWHHLPKLRDRARFDAWLNSTILNRCRDALRRRRRSREVALDGALELPSDDSSGATDDMVALTTAFERLSVDHRHLLVMHHLHRVPVADLARELGIPEGTTKWRLHAARAALTRALEADR